MRIEIEQAVYRAQRLLTACPPPAPKRTALPLLRPRRCRRLRWQPCLAAYAPLSNGFPLYAALASAAAAAQLIERRSPLGGVLPAPLASMLLALGGAASGLLPVACAAYDTIWGIFMPAAAALCLLESDMRQLANTAGPSLLAFAVGAAGSVLGTVMSFSLLGSRLGPEGWKLAAALCASYIGGSTNMVAVAAALQLSSGLAAVMAADNAAM